jgi:hypothetical protein
MARPEAQAVSLIRLAPEVLSSIPMSSPTSALFPVKDRTIWFDLLMISVALLTLAAAILVAVGLLPGSLNGVVLGVSIVGALTYPRKKLWAISRGAIRSLLTDQTIWFDLLKISVALLTLAAVILAPRNLTNGIVLGAWIVGLLAYNARHCGR